MYRVQIISNKESWETFVQSQMYTVFVQSQTYGDFYAAMGENAYILGIYKNETLVGGSLVVSTHAKRGNFFYVPYGPFLPKEGREGALKIWTDFIKNLAKEHGMRFVRVSPFLLEKEAGDLFQKEGYKKAPIHVLAETTWLLDVAPSEEELISAMNKNHRNLIRRCDREGVKVVASTSKEALDDLNKLMDTTAKRHSFTRFSRSYIEKEYLPFAEKNQAAVYRAYLPDGRLDSAAIIMFYGNMACYRHSGSLNLDNKLPTSYLVQWEVIKEVKRRGMRYYNFWGIAPEGAGKNHPFHGITHFKKGFGGFQRDIMPCQDLIVSPRYYFTRIIETIRRIKRGF